MGIGSTATAFAAWDYVEYSKPQAARLRLCLNKGPSG
jgi:hypothetical protein